MVNLAFPFMSDLPGSTLCLQCPMLETTNTEFNTKVENPLAETSQAPLNCKVLF